MKIRFLFVSSIVVLTAACGDETTSGSSNTTATSNGGSGGEPTTSVGGSGGTTNTGGGGSGAAGGSGGAGGNFDCSSVTLPDGPIAETVATSQFLGSEDIAFDGLGSIVGHEGTDLIKVDSSDAVTLLANVGSGLGLRYMQNGNLIHAQGRTLSQITPTGDVTPYVSGLGGGGTNANGVFVDFQDTVWVTLFGADEVLRIDSNLDETTIASGGDADQPNGVVLNADLNILYYNEYSQANVWSVDVSGNAPYTPVMIGSVSGGGVGMDGMTLDVCGNLYIVGQQNNRLYRLKLDATGAPGANVVEEIASFPTNVANPQFGSGPGWNTDSIYVAGNPGVVYEVPVGIAGRPVPTQP